MKRELRKQYPQMTFWTAMCLKKKKIAAVGHLSPSLAFYIYYSSPC